MRIATNRGILDYFNFATTIIMSMLLAIVPLN
jgi:hypothetical protein